jgi:hypothetical protein
VQGATCIVHKSLNIKRLRLEQIADVGSGRRVAPWKMAVDFTFFARNLCVPA